jgi:hypothetical protein
MLAGQVLEVLAQPAPPNVRHLTAAAINSKIAAIDNRKLDRLVERLKQLVQAKPPQ